MATIERMVQLPVPADEVWRVLRDFGRAGEVFADVLVDCRRDGDLRTVTFANGTVISERLVTLDDEARRLVYAVVDGPFTHHSSALQVAADTGGTRVTWTTDFLPDGAAARVKLMVEAGCSALVLNLTELAG
jgi:hypothetical protein